MPSDRRRPLPLSDTQPDPGISRSAWDENCEQEGADCPAIDTWLSQTDLLSKHHRIPPRNMANLLTVFGGQESRLSPAPERELCDAAFSYQLPDEYIPIDVGHRTTVPREAAMSPLEKSKLKDLERELEGNKSLMASLGEDLRLLEASYHDILDEMNAWKQLFYGQAENRRDTELGFPNSCEEKLVWKNRHIARLEKELSLAGERFRHLEIAAEVLKKRHAADRKDIQAMELDYHGLMDEILSWRRRYLLLVGNVEWVVDTLKRFMKRFAKGNDCERDVVMITDEGLYENSIPSTETKGKPRHDEDGDLAIHEGLNKALANVVHYLSLLHKIIN